MELNDRQDPQAPFTEQTLQAIFWLGERIPGGFFIYRADGDTEVLYVNRFVLDIYGCENLKQFRSLTGGTFRGMVHPDDYDEIQSSIDRQIGGEDKRALDYVEYRIVRRDGGVRWVDDYGHFAQLPGYGSVYYVFIWDVTDRRREREERFRMEVALEREKQKNELKTEFLFSISHDLRTPMNAIVGFSDLARRSAGDPERMLRYVEKVNTSSGVMMELLDDLLEMNRTTDGVMELREEPADLRAQLETILDIFRTQAEQKRVTLTWRLDLPDAPVLLDRSRFDRIMDNLIENAIKFTPEGGSVTVSASVSERAPDGGGRYRFTVSDTGVGMTQEFLSRAFEPFEREETSTQTGMSGTGVGLSIVRKLTDIMGGAVCAESVKGSGSVFTVELPLHPAAAAVPDAAAAEGRGCGKAAPRILIVDDVEFNRMLTEAVLEEAGFLTECAADGSQAVEAVRADPDRFDLILMDIQMPVMDGNEAARAIRALEGARHIPILALSANARAEDRAKSRQSGMDGHIAKPFDGPDLIRRIRESLAGAEE